MTARTARTAPTAPPYSVPAPAGWNLRLLRRHLRRSIKRAQDRRDLSDEERADAFVASMYYREDPASYNRVFFAVRAELNAQP